MSTLECGCIRERLIVHILVVECHRRHVNRHSRMMMSTTLMLCVSSFLNVSSLCGALLRQNAVVRTLVFESHVVDPVSSVVDGMFQKTVMFPQFVVVLDVVCLGHEMNVVDEYLHVAGPPFFENVVCVPGAI